MKVFHVEPRPGLEAHWARHFTVIDRPHFAWRTVTLLTLETAWLRRVYKRKRRDNGVWEYYNYAQGPERHFK